MPEDPTKPTLTFRNRSVNQEGKEIIEERIVSGCTAEELLTYINSPWENYPSTPDNPAEAESKNKSKEFAEILTEQFRQLQFIITAKVNEDGDKQWIIKCNPSQESAETKSAQLSAHEDKDSVKAAGHLSVKVLSDQEDEIFQYQANANTIDIKNHGLMVINKDNLYAIINMHMSLSLDQ